MNRTILLILLLVASAAGLLALSFNTGVKTQAPVQISQSTLYLTSPRASTSGTMTSNVVLNASSNKVYAVQLELSYNPQDISITSVTPGTFFKNPVELFKKIDSDNGKISYALGASLGQKVGVSGIGIVANLNFAKLKNSGTTSILFSPKTTVTELGQLKSVLKTATGVAFDLSK